jgi:hypothetical protein
VVFLLAIAKRHGDHVAEVAAILVYRHAILLTRVVRVDNVVDVFSGAEGCGDSAERKRYRARVAVRRGFG